VYGIDEMSLPPIIYDYDSMCKTLQPFVLTKEVYEEGVQVHRTTNMNPQTEILPQIQSQIQTNIHLKEEPIKITLVDCDVQNTHIEKPGERPLLPKSKNQNRGFTGGEAHYEGARRNIQVPMPPLPPLPPPPRHAKPEHSAPPFVPINSQPDPLFWCLFISMNGIKEYQYLNGRYTNRIVEEKQKLVNFIKSKEIESTMKLFLKKNKITGVSLKTMMSGVLSNEPVDFKNIVLYCYFYKVNVTFVNFEKRVCFTFLGNEEESESKNDASVYYIEFSLKTQPPQQTPNSTPPQEKQQTPPLVKKYKYSILTDEEKIKQSKTHFNIENVDKPLNAMTAYKICELNTIAQQLGLLNGKEEGVKMKKNDVYTLISDYFKEIL
jgi:hypothetical protein